MSRAQMLWVAVLAVAVVIERRGRGVCQVPLALAVR